MPRRRPREVELLLECHNQPVSDYLKKEVYRLKALAKEPLGECPVCQEELVCQKCTLLQACGHFVCATCYMRLVEHRCPVCRS